MVGVRCEARATEMREQLLHWQRGSLDTSPTKDPLTRAGKNNLTLWGFWLTGLLCII